MTDTPHFDIHPAVVLKLGQELIADEFTAILEAAKNSYDAGASKIRIKIDTQNPPDERFHSRYPLAKGTFSIWDDGAGMDSESIQKGWLLIAYSRKLDLKRKVRKAHERLKRVPLGDKGIGRLGLQRIGENVEVFTSTRLGGGHHVAFSWRDFERAATLSQVPVTIEQPQGKLREGTEILVSGLRRPELWRGTTGRDRLQSKLSQLVSPFDELRECEVEVILDGSALDLAQFSKSVLAVAEQHFTFEFGGEALKIRGEFGLDYLRLAADKYPVIGASIEEDDGRALVQHLSSGTGAVAREILYGEKPAARVLVERTIVLGSLGEVAVGETSKDPGRPVSPGPFKGEFFHFDRRERAGGFDRANDFKAFLDSQRGVRIYRNGFAFGRYGVDGGDWLGLGEAWTGGSSWFGLKPANIIGYISISAADNPLLQEKTDREGLTDSPAAANFLRLVQEVVRYANAVNAHLRRGIVEFGKQLSLDDAGERILDPEAVSRRLSQARTATDRAKKAALGLENERTFTVKEVVEVERAISVADALAAEVERLQIELRSMVDLAAVGLTTEALFHEIANIADRLAQKVKVVSRSLSKTEPPPRIVEFVEHVRGVTAALRKQLAHLTPALRFARERRERFDVRDFIKDQADYFSDRFRDKSLEMRVDLGNEAMQIHASRGKLTQVFDNLLLNSEYWLEEQKRRNVEGPAAVTIRIRPPRILVSDSGPGIDQSIEPRLFQPFVSLKPKGRGLGLFIVRQLLDSMGCSISLRDERNTVGRRYVFDLDLSGAMDGDEKSA